MNSVADLVEPVKLEARASVDNYKKGKEIAANNGVMIEVFNPLKVVAKVTSPGMGVQHTELDSVPGGLHWNCTCNDQHQFCSHLVATAIVAWANAPKHRNPKAGESNAGAA